MGKKILIVCAHEPHLDPRIKWVHDSLRKKFSVEVVGINHRSTAVKEEKCVRTLPPNREGKITFLKQILRKFWQEPKINTIVKFLFLVLLSLFALMVTPIFLFYKALKKLGINEDFLKKKLIFLNKTYLIKDVYKFTRLSVDLLDSNLTVFNYLIHQRKFDVIYANDFDTLIGVVLFKNQTGVKIIYDCHEFWPHSHTNSSWLHVKFFECLEGIFIQEADHVVTVNPLLAREVKRTYGKEVGYLYNAAPLPANKSEGLAFYFPLLKKFEREVLFLFHGAFAPFRGLEELVLGWEKFSSQKGGGVLFIRGPLNSPDAGQLKEFCEKLTCYERSLFFLDAVAEDDLINAAKPFDVGIIPYKPIDLNYKYCCPNKLSQYMQSGLAIMANRTLFVQEFVETYGIGKIYGGDDPQSIAETLRYFVENLAELKKYKENALKCVREFYHWEAQEEKLYALING